MFNIFGKNKPKGWYADYTNKKVVPVYTNPYKDNGYDMRELPDGTAVLEISISRTKQDAYTRLVESIGHQARELHKDIDKLRKQLLDIEEKARQDGVQLGK